jgi:hypothetical protein
MVTSEASLQTINGIGKMSKNGRRGNDRGSFPRVSRLRWWSLTAVRSLMTGRWVFDRRHRRLTETSSETEDWQAESCRKSSKVPSRGLGGGEVVRDAPHNVTTPVPCMRRARP